MLTGAKSDVINSVRTCEGAETPANLGSLYSPVLSYISDCYRNAIRLRHTDLSQLPAGLAQGLGELHAERQCASERNGAQPNWLKRNDQRVSAFRSGGMNKKACDGPENRTRQTSSKETPGPTRAKRCHVLTKLGLGSQDDHALLLAF